MPDNLAEEKIQLFIIITTVYVHKHGKHLHLARGRHYMYVCTHMHLEQI